MKLLAILCFTMMMLFAHAQDYTMEGMEVKISKPIQFETGSDKLLTESDAAITIIKNYLEAKTYITLMRVEGHTDGSGDPETSQSLSEKRALAVCKRLVEMGIDCKRLIAVGFGGTKPIAINNTPENKATNRRISFVNAALRDKMIGGMPADGGGVVSGDVCD
ncbi:MAG: OmpA family protein [Bacteroidota bacterium]